MQSLRSAADAVHDRCSLPSRRRERDRAPRNIGPSFAPLPRLSNPWAPLEVLNDEQVERILAAAYQILEEAGLEMRSVAAREI